MSTEVNLGGDRLGSGNKMKLQLRNYERSTHDLGRIWRSTMATGTLVPFLKEVALPGDTFDINLRADVKTLPTLGPLFASFKLQLDIFMCPMRLYNAQLHMNKVGVGMDMSKVKFPTISVLTDNLRTTLDEPFEIQQINQSSLLAYLGIRGNGYRNTAGSITRLYNAMPFLMYWDIYKNYYSNKQEEIGMYLTPDLGNVINFIYFDGVDVTATKPNKVLAANSTMDVWTTSIIDDNDLIAYITEDAQYVQLNMIFENFTKYTTYAGNKFVISSPVNKYIGKTIELSKLKQKVDLGYKTVKIASFPLSNIDKMRENVLKQASTSALSITSASALSPYSDILNYQAGSQNISYSKWALNGLGLKTYQSDIFNNWLKTEWLDGATGINEITAISTVGDKFTLDTLNLSKKVYDMLNRIAVSGGTYEDWLQAVYTHNAQRRAESPVYLGGLSKEIVFQEVISTAEANAENPLGSLAGRGVLGQKNKGGYVIAKIDEPSYIMGIISITPRVDYSQGNDWDLSLTTMNDLHKPALDGIGFQDLVTWKMAAWEQHNISGNNVTFSAGKQPAWLDYMTSYNRCFGDFANPDDQMFMTLNRRYEMDGNFRIKDLTTYIDPQKYNYIFANTRRDSQNFWVQLGIDITARRKMSAKQIPNL